MPQATTKTISDLALSADQVEGELLEIRFVPLSTIKKLDRVLWAKNAKKHDDPSILASVEKYGFVDPPKWDQNLNEGKGGLVYGNGRTKVIVEALLQAKKQGMSPPRGIPTIKTSGEWCIPVKFGINAATENEAMALAIDHNNLTMSGDDFDAKMIAKMWDSSYLDILEILHDADQLPVTVDDVDYRALLDEPPDFQPTSPDEQGQLDQKAPPKQINCTCPECGHEFSQTV